MQEKSSSESDYAPEVKTHPVNNLSSLEPLITQDAIDEFKQSLISPVGYQILIDCLKLALKHRAHSIVDHLSKCQLSKVDGDANSITKNVQGSFGKKLFNLIYLDYAEYFRSSDKEGLRTQFFNKIRISKNRDLFIAAISGDVSKLKETDIPKKPTSSKGFHEFILYPVANDHAEVVRYLHEHKHNPHNLSFNKNAMVVAIEQNANQVFDYLIQTKFDPNATLYGNFLKCPFPEEDCRSLLRLTIRYQRLRQFEQLVEKGATITDDIFRLAIMVGNEDIIDCCRKKINFPSDSIAVAIKSGNLRLALKLCNNGSASHLNTFDTTGLTPLCYAVIYNQLNIVKEFVLLGANIMAVNKAGTNAILIAADLNHIEILEYLLASLKSKISETELVAFLNKGTCTNPNCKDNHNILFELANNTTRPWRSVCDPVSKASATKTCIELLIKYEACLFVKRSEHVLLSYVGNKHDSYTGRKEHLNFFAVQQLTTIPKLVSEYLSPIEQLENFYHKRSIGETWKPDLAALSRCKKHLNAFERYTKTVSLENLAEIIITRPLNVPNILYKLIKTLTSQTIQTSANTLPRIIASLLALPNCALKLQICLALADKVYNKAVETQNPNPVLFVIARHLYNAACIEKNLTIEQKINTCTQRMGSFSLTVATPTKEEQAYLMNKLIDLAIAFNDVDILNQLLDHKASQIITSWPMEDFKKFYTTCCSNPNFFSNFIYQASPKIFDMINLRLLLIGNYDYQTPKLLGIYLRDLTGKTARRLLILAHILTFFQLSIAKPEAIKNIFEKALLELADIQHNSTDDFNVTVQKYYKHILVAILKIRLEIVKLLAKDFTTLETLVTNIDYQNDQIFFEQFETITIHIAQIIDENLTQHNLSLATDFLDQIELDCLKQLNQARDTSISDFDPLLFNFNFEADNMSSEGKRPPSSDIFNPTPKTRLKSEGL